MAKNTLFVGLDVHAETIAVAVAEGRGKVHALGTIPRGHRASRDRFPTAASLQKSAGIAPVMERSGNKAWVHWRHACNKFVRQTFVEWAAQTIPRSF